MIKLKKKHSTPTGSIWTFHSTIRVVPANIHLDDPKAKGWWLTADRLSNQAVLDFFANEDRSFDTLAEAKRWIKVNFDFIASQPADTSVREGIKKEFDFEAWATAKPNEEQLADQLAGV